MAVDLVVLPDLTPSRALSDELAFFIPRIGVHRLIADRSVNLLMTAVRVCWQHRAITIRKFPISRRRPYSARPVNTQFFVLCDLNEPTTLYLMRRFIQLVISTLILAQTVTMAQTGPDEDLIALAHRRFPEFSSDSAPVRRFTYSKYSSYCYTRFF